MAILSSLSIVPESVRLCWATEYVIVGDLVFVGDEVATTFVETAVAMLLDDFHRLWLSSY